MIEDNDKTREQLLDELSVLRQENTRLRDLETEPGQAAEALRESEEKFRLLFENMTEGVGLHEMIRDCTGKAVDYRILDVNPAFTQHTGIPPERARGSLAGELYGACAPPYLKEYEDLVSDGKPLFFETYFPPLKKHFRISAMRTKPDHFATVFLDITDRKLAENAIRASEERFRSLVEVTSDWIWETNDKGVFCYSSPKVKDLLGYETDEVVGKSPLDFMPADEAQNLAPTLNEHARTREPFVVLENWNQHKSGKLVFLQTSGVPIFDEDGTWRGFRGIDRDITDRKQAEDALRESEERLRLTLEATDDGVWDWNIPTGRSIFSPRYYTMLGYGPYEFPQAYESWRNLVHPDDLGRAEKDIEEHIAGGQGYAIEIRMRTKSGDWKWILSRGKVVARDLRGRALRMAGVHSDITERKRAEEQVKASLREKEVLLKEIHHRVKNNLQIISSLLNMQSKRIDDQGSEALRESMNRIKSMALVHDKLYRAEDLSRIYFADYISDLSRELVRTYVTEKGIELDIHVDPVSFDVDTAIPLGLVISELVSNALKHAFREKPGGLIRISVKSLGNQVMLTISDNGIGFPEHLDFTNTQSLGMQLVVTLVEQLEGTIELHVSEGTEFRIAFPATGQ
jgi:PAS domain S-box-containing protein